jgi:hypothetical protein
MAAIGDEILEGYTAVIIHEILKDYALPIRGPHGVVHWARVLENGLRLASATGANSCSTTHAGSTSTTMKAMDYEVGSTPGRYVGL